LRKIEAAVRDLRSRYGLQRQPPRQEIAKLCLDPAAVRPNSQHPLHYGIPVAQLKVSARQDRRKVPSEAHARLHFPHINSYGRVCEMLVVMAGKHHRQEWSELNWTLDDVVPESYMEILKRTVIVAIVDGKLMRIRSAILAETVGETYIDRNLIGLALIELLNRSEYANVPIVMTRAVSVNVLSVE
jgi:hypothetical protein